MIGKILKTMRKNKKLNQKQLGSIIGVAQTTLSGYETGYSNPDFALIKKIADSCDYDIVFINRNTKEKIISK